LQPLSIPITNLQQGSMLTCGLRYRCLLEAKYFLRGLHGTQTHINSVMSDLGWRKPVRSASLPNVVVKETEPNLELFLWAILTGRAEMALIFWRRQDLMPTCFRIESHLNAFFFQKGTHPFHATQARCFEP
jgi:hypothetical protein